MINVDISIDDDLFWDLVDQYPITHMVLKLNEIIRITDIVDKLYEID